MTTEPLFKELKDFYRTDGPVEFYFTVPSIDRWTNQLAVTRNALYDLIGVWIAEGFHKHELDFEFCDAVVNDIFAFADANNGFPMPDLFWEVFLAFDAGEYSHLGDRDVDPIEKYTRPSIKALVERLNKS